MEAPKKCENNTLIIGYFITFLNYRIIHFSEFPGANPGVLSLWKLLMGPNLNILNISSKKPIVSALYDA